MIITICLANSYFLESVRFYPNFYKYEFQIVMFHVLVLYCSLFRNFRERKIQLLKASTDRFRLLPSQSEVKLPLIRRIEFRDSE